MQDRRRGWWVVVAMFALNGLFLGPWASRVPAVAERYGLSPGGLGLVLLAIGLAVSVATFPGALAGFALIGMGQALVIPLAFGRAANDPVVKPGRAIAGVATLGYGGVLLGPPIIGFVAEATSVRFSFAVVAVLALALAITGFARALDPPRAG